MNPISHFIKCLNEEKAVTKVRIPSACCLSSIGLDGFPNARFVSLKEVVDGKFIVTGSLSSRKGREINFIPKIALSFWWTETERQVRIQGIAKEISSEHAEKYFNERDRESQIVSIVSQQGSVLENPELLQKSYDQIDLEYANKPLPKPQDWGGFAIEPIRIEFLEFKSSRFHERTLFKFEDGSWIMSKLQP